MSIDTYQQQEAKQNRLLPVVILSLLAALLVIGTSSNAQAAERDQAKRIHDRLAGVPPTSATLDAMEALLVIGTPANAIAAANIALNHPDFYRVTLKNFVTPWTNEEQTVFAPLNDYTATVIGIADTVSQVVVMAYQQELAHQGAVGHTDADARRKPITSHFRAMYIPYWQRVERIVRALEKR